MKFLRIARPSFVCLAVLLLAGCVGPEPAALQPASPLNLKAYATQTISVKPTPTMAATEIPIPTPTPSSYSIQRGDTLLDIARRFGVSLAELLAANPGVAPEALAVGQVIQIPAPRALDVLPLPASAKVGQAACYSVGRDFPSGKGVYCFVPVSNAGQGWLENIKVQVTLLDAAGRQVTSEEALLPLTVLGAGKTLPAVAFFPNVEIGLPSGAETFSAALLTAIQTDSARYLPVELKNLLVGVAWGGLSAQVKGQAWLAAESKPASIIWLAGVAYDADGTIVGVRRWEWSGLLAPGEALPFGFMVYSAGAPIARVDVLAEARP